MLGFGNNTFLGIDIGTSSVKIAEIKVSNNKPVLSNYAWMNLGGVGHDTQIDFSEESLVQCLKKVLREGQLKSKNVYISMPAFGGLITLIEFPQMSKVDLDQAIKFEAHKYIPTSMEDIALSWDVLNQKAEIPLLQRNIGGGEKKKEAISDEKLQVLLVAAPKSKVEKYEKIIKNAGLVLNSIEIESFSIVRSLVGNDTGNFVIVDIGSRICNIILVEKGVIKVNRNLDAGGRDITRQISIGMNIGEERAESMKVSGSGFFDRNANIKLTPVDLIIEETRRVLGTYYKNVGEQKVDGIILSGGTAGLSGIERYFFEALNIKTMIGNPLGRIEYDHRLDPKLRAIAPQLSVCIGLALKGAEDFINK